MYWSISGTVAIFYYYMRFDFFPQNDKKMVAHGLGRTDKTVVAQSTCRGQVLQIAYTHVLHVLL